MVYGLSSGLIAALTLFFPLSSLYAAEKNWIGSGDGINWNDDSNWFPVMEPALADEVTVNVLDAPVVVREEFNAKSLSIGGNITSSVSVEENISGTIAPATASDVAVLDGVGGKFILKGAAGTVTLRGKYKDSETPLSDEPALVFYFE